MGLFRPLNASVIKRIDELSMEYIAGVRMRRETEMLFNDRPVPRFRSFERPARRKLLYLHRARTLRDLAVPPGNQLEALKGGRTRTGTFLRTLAPNRDVLWNSGFNDRWRC